MIIFKLNFLEVKSSFDKLKVNLFNTDKNNLVSGPKKSQIR